MMEIGNKVGVYYEIENLWRNIMRERRGNVEFKITDSIFNDLRIFRINITIELIKKWK